MVHDKKVLGFAFAFLLTSLMVSSQVKARARRAALDGSFIQSYYCELWSGARWRREFRMMKQVGMHYLVIGPAAQSYPGKITETFFPSTLPNTKIVADMVGTCLRNAEAAGIKVFVGIDLSKKWWGLTSKDSTWLYDQMRFDNKICDELWRLYKKKYPEAFYGWYWAYEVANFNLTKRDDEILTKAMNIQLDHLETTHEKLPFMWCPFMNYRFGSAKAYEDMWINVFHGLHTTRGDIFCPQDCVGAGGLKLDQVATWFSALRKAVDTKLGLVMWSDVETFDGRNWTAAPLNRVISQMKIERPFVDNYISFAYCHYDFPHGKYTGFQQTYLDYLKTGSLEKISPTTPPNFTAVLEPDGNVRLKWGRSTDNIGVCGYYVYRDGQKICTTQIPRPDDGTELHSSLTSLVDACLRSNTNYTYQVRAYDYAGNLSAPTGAITVNTGKIAYLPNDVSLGCPYTVSIPAYTESPGEKDTQLTDGCFADTASAKDNRWEGFPDTHQKPRDVVIDLGKRMPVQQFVADFLLDREALVYLPAKVTVLVSTDGKKFDRVGKFRNPNVPSDASAGSYKYRLTLSGPVSARYVDFRTLPTVRWFFELTFEDEFEVRSNGTVHDKCSVRGSGTTESGWPFPQELPDRSRCIVPLKVAIVLDFGVQTK